MENCERENTELKNDIVRLEALLENYKSTINTMKRERSLRRVQDPAPFETYAEEEDNHRFVSPPLHLKKPQYPVRKNNLLAR